LHICSISYSCPLHVTLGNGDILYMFPLVISLLSSHLIVPLFSHIRTCISLDILHTRGLVSSLPGSLLTVRSFPKFCLWEGIPAADTLCSSGSSSLHLSPVHGTGRSFGVSDRGSHSVCGESVVASNLSSGLLPSCVRRVFGGVNEPKNLP